MDVTGGDGVHALLSGERPNDLVAGVREDEHGANAVLPGPHDTGDLELFLTELVEAGRYGDLEAAEAAITADAGVDELGDPLDLGKLVAFLSSEHAGHVNGAAVPVDGGAG
jgi:NAD(P)-dependent dehydrogenase (short-subunit alcohol dehydrogenase family)